MRAIGLFAAFLVFGCLKPEPTGLGSDGAQTPVGDDSRMAGATSSTNWPPEDVGTLPIQIIGTADSVLTFSFKQVLTRGSTSVPTRLAATFLLFRVGYNPLFDSVPTLRMDFPVSDSCKIKAEDLNPLLLPEMDTLRFTLEVRTDSVRGLFPGFTYSKKQKKFLEWPSPVNDTSSANLTGPHYEFAGIPDSGFRSFQSDTSGNVKLYYYIPATPYFWPQKLGHDSLYIGPTVYGRFPLRCVKVVSIPDPKAVYKIDVYDLIQVKELVYDSLHHAGPSTVFKLGEPVLHAQRQGQPQLRAPE